MKNFSVQKPNLFIVGHPRSGTSSLHAYLSQHAVMKNFCKKKMVKYKPRSELNDELRAKLMKKIKPEIENLSNALDLDLVTRWGYHKI